MNVSLTPELEAFVHAQVASGQYASASEVVRQSLRLLEEYETKRAWLKAAVAQGLESARTEPMHDGNSAFWETLLREANERHTAGQQSA